MDQRFLEREDARTNSISLQQRSHGSSGSSLDQQHPDADSMLSEYLRTLNRHRMQILSFAFSGLVLALLLGFGTRPIYRTRTSLDIRSLNGDFMDMRSVAPTGSNSAADTDTNLQTQIKLLQSETLLQQVTDKLLAEPHPETILRNDLLSRLARMVHLGGNEPILYTNLVAHATKNIKVKPLGLTRLVEVTCDSWDAKFSAHFCNTLTATFGEQDLQTRAAEAEKTSEWLTRQVADVRLRAEESQKKLEQAVGGNGLMLSQTSTSPGEERLRSLQVELVRAQADRMQKQAQSNVASSAAPDTLPDVQDNPEHRSYDLKLADLRSQLAALVPALTEQNPKVIRLRSQIADTEAGLLATQFSSTRRQYNEYEAARHREELLQVTYRAQEAMVSSDLQKAARVSLLRRELDSEQQLYQTLLQRAKEAGFASAMQATTIRVVDMARTPLTPSSPRRGLSGAAGLVLGSMVGLGLAFRKDRSNKVFRAPGEITRFLNLLELGVIPAAKQVKKSKGLPSITGARTAGSPSGQGEVVSLTRWNDDFSLAAEAYRNATFSILLSDTSKRSRSYVISSPSSGEGKTTVTSNLGIALSKSKLRVVLIDGDLRRPSLHRAFSLENSYGLRNILRGEVDLETISTKLLTCRTALSSIDIIPAGQGSEDVIELLHSSYFGALLARLSRDFDVILIDTPPILHMADARVLAGQSDGAVLVLRASVTTREQAAGARDLFDRDGVRLVGTILNDFDPSREGKAGYYESYYRYQQQGESAEVVGAGS